MLLYGDSMEDTDKNLFAAESSKAENYINEEQYVPNFIKGSRWKLGADRGSLYHKVLELLILQE